MKEKSGLWLTIALTIYGLATLFFAEHMGIGFGTFGMGALFLALVMWFAILFPRLTRPAPRGRSRGSDPHP